MEDKGLTFGGFPMTFELIDGEVYATCKGVTGSLTQVEKFLKKKDKTRCYFGVARMTGYPNKMVKIDCLKDTKEQLKFLFNHAKQIQENGEK
jgi:hypothetical protein